MSTLSVLAYSIHPLITISRFPLYWSKSLDNSILSFCISLVNHYHFCSISEIPEGKWIEKFDSAFKALLDFARLNGVSMQNVSLNYGIYSALGETYNKLGKHLIIVKSINQAWILYSMYQLLHPDGHFQLTSFRTYLFLCLWMCLSECMGTMYM